MNTTRFGLQRRFVALLLISMALLAACAPATAAVPEGAAAMAEAAESLPAFPATSVPAAATATSPDPAVASDPSMPAGMVPAATIRPTENRQQPATATSVATTAPTQTLTPTTTPTPVPSPTTAPGRYCPEVAPLKPEYDRFYLSGKKWPFPDPAIAGPHFWLSHPLPGGDRVLTNQRFPYGWDENGRLLLHNGVDVSADLGTPLLAVADGTVVVAQADLTAWYGWRCDWYGHLVVIELDERWQDQPVYVLYGHVLNLKVEAGERVTRGQEVAEIGFGGAATHPHLHLEVRVGENEFWATRNPMLWLDPGPSRGVIAGRLVDPEGRPWQGVPLFLTPVESGESATTWSYLGDPEGLMNPDEGWAENFVFSDVAPGAYELYASIQEQEYRLPVVVSPGQVTLVELQTEPYKEAQPEPATTTETTPTPVSG